MRLLPLAMLLCHSYYTFSQSSSTILSARAHALGNAAACLSDEWSVINNIGGLASVKQVTTAFSLKAVPQFKSFNRMAMVGAIPTQLGVAGFSVYRFGDDLYNEQILSAGFSNRFGLASLGIKANYIQYNAEGFGRKDAVTISAGGIAEITPQILVGAYIVNINQPKLEEGDERIPTILTAGIAFKPTNKLFITTEIEKDLDYAATWKAGIEYQVHKKFLFRTGFNINPNAGFVGLGFRPARFLLDYAFEYASHLGGQHQATVGYQFIKRKNEIAADRH